MENDTRLFGEVTFWLSLLDLIEGDQAGNGESTLEALAVDQVRNYDHAKVNNESEVRQRDKSARELFGQKISGNG